MPFDLSTFPQDLQREVWSEVLACADVAHWACSKLGFVLDDWQAEMGNAVAVDGMDTICLCGRQQGKSTGAGVALAHVAEHRPGSLSLVLAASERQAIETFRKAAGFLHQRMPAVILEEKNKLSLATKSGSRIVSLPASEASTRGYSIDGVLVLDEAARISREVIIGVDPAVSVAGGTRLMISTPAGRDNSFAEVWHGDDPAWLRIARSGVDNPRLSERDLQRQKLLLGPVAYAQEFLLDFDVGSGSGLIARGTIERLFVDDDDWADQREADDDEEEVLAP